MGGCVSPATTSARPGCACRSSTIAGIHRSRASAGSGPPATPATPSDVATARAKASTSRGASGIRWSAFGPVTLTAVSTM